MTNHRLQQRQCGAYSLFLLFAVIIVSSCTSQPRYPAPPIKGSEAVFEVSTLQEDVPRFYTYQVQNKPVSFFVLKLHDRVTSFLDACVTCYPHKQGYRHDDGFVTCRYCNMRFSLFKLEKGIGGCYPIKIEGRIENGKYLIPLAALEAEADKF